MRAFDVGARFGRLVVLSRHGEKARSVTVQCDCGTVKTVLSNNLRRGVTRSCGCYMRERAHECNVRHGLTESHEHHAWIGAKGRCFNSSNHAFASYGGRGITMCDRWRDSFEAFLQDMGPRPEGMTLDRIDNDGPYSPDNCRWATRQEQANNRRSSRQLTAFGRTQTIRAWSDETGIHYDVIKQRVAKLRWTPEDAVSRPVRREAA